MSRGRAKFTEADVGRILKAAAKAGVDVRVEIQPSGTMVVTSGKSGKPIEDKPQNGWDEVLKDEDETAPHSNVRRSV